MPKAVDDFFSHPISACFPKATDSDLQMFAETPQEFCLECPLILQEDPLSAAVACARMLSDYHGLSAPSSNIANNLMIKDPEDANHETHAEDFAREAVDLGLIPYPYYPGRFVLPSFPTGIEGANLIASSYEIVTPFDMHLLKTAIYHSKALAFIKLHFDIDEYEMPDAMAMRLDTAGHPVIVVGFDNLGLIVNDPWNKAWGGLEVVGEE